MVLTILLTVIVPVNSSNEFDSPANTIVILGDSLSAGYGVNIDSSWPSLLEKSIKNNNLDFQVINAGISGDTTSGGLFRLPKLLSRHKPKIVVLELGGNDGLRGMSLKKVVRKNLKAMIEMVHTSGGIAVLIGVELPPNYGKMYTSNFQQIFVDLASEYNLILINGSIKDMTEMGLMQSDGIHPNQDGHKLIEKEVWANLSPLLNKVSAD
ncbi:arylesterase [Gammaproteobacteria bacterium]|nr:arylesterase [Gammaproteobacteria bacterium]